MTGSPDRGAAPLAAATSQGVPRLDARQVRRWVVLYWVLIGVLAVGRDAVAGRIGQGDSMVAGAASAAIWFLAFAVSLRLVRGWRLVRYRDLLVLIAAAAALAVTTLFVLNLFSCYPAARTSCTPADQLGTAMIFLPVTFATVLSFLTVGCAVNHARSYRETEARVATVGAELSRAQAAALAGQLRPHFLFNSLQSIAVLIHHAPSEAARMLRALRRLFEHSLRISDEPTVTLREEVQLLRMYLVLETVRFQDRLQVEISVDERVDGALVPPFLLQPLVENAIRHVAAARSAGRVKIVAEPTKDGTHVRIVIWDSGSKGRSCEGERTGIGLSNTKARLRNLFDEDCDILLEVDGEPGTRVTVVLPLAGGGGGVAGNGIRPP
jgi:two-component system, LytTR family, sensor kinase